MSFEDRFEARKFLNDLASLAISEAELSRLQIERDRRRAYAARFIRDDCPKTIFLNSQRRFMDVDASRWINIVEPQGQSAGELRNWAARALEGKYLAAAWTPGEIPSSARQAHRRRHLTQDDWQTLIEQCRDEQQLLIVNLMSATDYVAFDRAYGPGSLLSLRPARLSPSGRSASYEVKRRAL